MNYLFHANHAYIFVSQMKSKRRNFVDIDFAEEWKKFDERRLEQKRVATAIERSPRRPAGTLSNVVRIGENSTNKPRIVHSPIEKHKPLSRQNINNLSPQTNSPPKANVKNTVSQERLITIDGGISRVPSGRVQFDGQQYAMFAGKPEQPMIPVVYPAPPIYQSNPNMQSYAPPLVAASAYPYLNVSLPQHLHNSAVTSFSVGLMGGNSQPYSRSPLNHTLRDIINRRPVSLAQQLQAATHLNGSINNNIVGNPIATLTSGINISEKRFIDSTAVLERFRRQQQPLTNPQLASSLLHDIQRRKIGQGGAKNPFAPTNAPPSLLLRAAGQAFIQQQQEFPGTHPSFPIGNTQTLLLNNSTNPSLSPQHNYNYSLLPSEPVISHGWALQPHPVEKTRFEQREAGFDALLQSALNNGVSHGVNSSLSTGPLVNYTQQVNHHAGGGGGHVLGEPFVNAPGVRTLSPARLSPARPLLVGDRRVLSPSVRRLVETMEIKEDVTRENLPYDEFGGDLHHLNRQVDSQSAVESVAPANLMLPSISTLSPRQGFRKENHADQLRKEQMNIVERYNLNTPPQIGIAASDLIPLSTTEPILNSRQFSDGYHDNTSNEINFVPKSRIVSQRNNIIDSSSDDHMLIKRSFSPSSPSRKELQNHGLNYLSHRRNDSAGNYKNNNAVVITLNHKGNYEESVPSTVLSRRESIQDNNNSTGFVYGNINSNTEEEKWSDKNVTALKARPAVTSASVMFVDVNNNYKNVHDANNMLDKNPPMRAHQVFSMMSDDEVAHTPPHASATVSQKEFKEIQDVVNIHSAKQQAPSQRQSTQQYPELNILPPPNIGTVSIFNKIFNANSVVNSMHQSIPFQHQSARGNEVMKTSAAAPISRSSSVALSVAKS